MIQVITDETFEKEVLKSELPVVVDFFAVWCGPCKMLSPILEQLSEELDGQVKFAKIDIDQNMAADTYRIQAVPTLKFFKNGEVVGESVGLVSKEALKQRLAAF